MGVAQSRAATVWSCHASSEAARPALRHTVATITQLTSLPSVSAMAERDAGALTWTLKYLRSVRGQPRTDSKRTSPQHHLQAPTRRVGVLQTLNRWLTQHTHSPLHVFALEHVQLRHSATHAATLQPALLPITDRYSNFVERKRIIERVKTIRQTSVTPGSTNRGHPAPTKSRPIQDSAMTCGAPSGRTSAFHVSIPVVAQLSRSLYTPDHDISAVEHLYAAPSSLNCPAGEGEVFRGGSLHGGGSGQINRLLGALPNRRQSR